VQIRVPFAFEAEVRVEGRRGAEKRILGEWATVDIREVSAGDAPCFAEFRQPGDGGRGVTSAVREFDGNCYRPKVRVPHGSAYDIFAPRVTAADLWADVPIVKTFFRHGWGDVTSRGTEGIEPDDVLAVTEAANRGTDGFRIVTSFRDAVLQRNLRAAADLIVIDGQIWERSLPPHLRLSLSDRPPEVTVVFEKPNARRVLKDDIIVPISEMQTLVEAVEAFHRIDERRELTDERGRQYLEREWTPAQVVYPEVVSIAPGPISTEAPYLVGRAEHYLKANFGHAIGDLQDRSAGFVQKWVDLKVATEAASADPSLDNLDDVLHHMRSFLEACRHEPPHCGPHGQPLRDAVRAKARTALRLEKETGGWGAFLDRRRDFDLEQVHPVGAPRP